MTLAWILIALATIDLVGSVLRLMRARRDSRFIDRMEDALLSGPADRRRPTLTDEELRHLFTK